MIKSLLIANHARHAELVSASILPQRRKAERRREVCPESVTALDHVDLPLPVPALDLFLSQDRPLHVAKHFIPDEHVNRISAGEAGYGIGAVLVQSGDEIRRHTSIERPIGLAGEDISARLLTGHIQQHAAKWMLKQVQHDGEGEVRD